MLLSKKQKTMSEYSTWWMLIELGGWVTFWMILSYFWLTAEALMILTVFLWVDILFWVIDSYIVTKDTSSRKLIEWIARKFWRRALPFVTIAALKWIWYDNIEAISNIIMSVLILSEWYSVLWHIYSINYWEKLKEIDALKWLFEMLANLFKWQISSSTNTKDDEKKKQDK